MPVPKNKRFLVLSMLVLAALPLLTQLIAYGRLPADWGVFPPPRSPNVPGFHWAVFVPGVGLALLLVAFLVFPRWFGFVRKPAAAPPRQPARTGVPWWFWLGTGTCVAAWAVMWGAVPSAERLESFCFVPLWWGFILALDGVVYRRTGGTSLIARRPRGMLAIAVASGVCWYFFEYLNYFVLSNWYYPNDEIFSELGYVAWFGLAYTTVFPSIFVFYNLLTTFESFRARYTDGPRVSLSRRAWWRVFWIGAGSLVLLVLWPAELFPMLWLSPLCMLGAALMLAGRWTPFTPLARGDWSALTLISTACVLNYFVGEMWNFYSTAANPNFWKYDVPYVNVLPVFEMPVLGYFGYLPFGVFCWLWWLHNASLFDADPAIDVVPGAGPMLAGSGTERFPVVPVQGVR